ncbi:MAG: M20/M25/M40 family metallo-hydrolase [Steroidobacterales bacterium]
MRLSPVLMGLALSSAGIAAAGPWQDEVTQASQRNFPEFLELLAHDNVAASAANIQRNAALVEELLRKRGFRTQQLTNPADRPAVFAELPRRTAGAKTVLLYIHMDGQPVIAAQWAQKDPFEPVVKERNAAGEWQEVSRDRLQAQPFDPELRVFARSASDDKAPIAMLLTAVDLLVAKKQQPAVNVKVIIDGEEEISSPSLAGMMQAYAALVAADALVILDGPAHASGRPTLAFGNRGIAQARLTVYGPRAPLHSGHFGNYAPNPAFRLARLLASMKGDDGRVLVKGYYDGIVLTTADREVLARAGNEEEAFRQRIGVAHAEAVGASYWESLQYPSLNIRGMASAAVGERVANIVPSEAVAELDMRTVPEADGRHLFELARAHIEGQGYHLVNGAPTEADRAQYDKLATFELGDVQAAERQPIDSPVGRWAMAALRSKTSPTPGADPVVIRMMGGTVPTDVLVDALHLPFVLVPTVNADNNQHAHDENLRIGVFVSGTEIIYSLLTTPWPR